MKMLRTLVWLAAIGPLVAIAAEPAAQAVPAEKKGAPAAPEVWKEPLTGMAFVKLPKGCYAMGNAKPVSYREYFRGLPPKGQDFKFEDELPRHEACVDAFWLGQFEVRADEWHKVMGGTPIRSDAPAAGMNWNEANRFAALLSERSGGKVRFRLPTEAEWEYACRAGAKEDIVAKRDELRGSAWYAVEPDGIKSETQPVGQLPANAFGLHDMLGNVWEWVQDSYQNNAYLSHGLYNPAVRVPAPDRVIRGASFRSQPLHVRCAKRSHYASGDSLNTIGLRLVRTP